MYTDKITQAVAEAVKKVMAEELSAKQKSIAKIAGKKSEIDSADLAALRSGAKPVKEDIEQLDEIRDVEQYKAKIAKEKEHVKKIEAGTRMKPGEDGKMKRHFSDPDSYYAHNERTEKIAKMEKALAKHQSKTVKEGWQDMLDDVKKRAAPQPNGGAGMKQGSRYGGSKQKDEPEDKKKNEEVDINAINGVKMSNVDESSHQAKTTMKHIPNASPALKKAAKDIKPGIAGFRDRVAMLKAGGVKK